MLLHRLIPPEGLEGKVAWMFEVPTLTLPGWQVESKKLREGCETLQVQWTTPLFQFIGHCFEDWGGLA